MTIGVATLWIGKSLSPLERLSLTSLVNHGHKVTLYSYNPVEAVPKGVICRDAGEILCGERILRYNACGSPALHSNFFRLRLLQKTADVWVDTDVIAIRRLPVEEAYLLSFARMDLVSNAVLRLPKSSPTIRTLVDLYMRGRGNPPQWSLSKKIKRVLRTGKIGLPLEDWPYGEAGPTVLTQYLRRTGEISHVMPQTAFSPVNYKNCRDLITPGALTAAKLPADCKAVHCFAKGLKQILNESPAGVPPEGSFLREQFKLHKVDPFPATAWHPAWNMAI